MKFSFALAASVLFLPALVNAQSEGTPGPTPAPAAPTGPGETTPAGPAVSAPPSNPGPGTTAPASSFASPVPSSSEQTTAPSDSVSATLSSPVATAPTSSLSSGSGSGSGPAGQASTGTVTPEETMHVGSSLSGSNAAGTSATAPTSTSSPAVQAICPSTNTCVQVAPGGQLGYAPSNFPASNGTVVTFIFPSDSGDNSVTQSSFADPCVYLITSSGNPAGFDSGLQNGKLFSVKITNDQLPIYFFSKKETFCGQGMVGGINIPATGNTYNAYLDAAKALGSNEKPVPDNGPVLGGVGAQAVGTPSPIPSSSASHLVPNGLVALLAAALGVTLA